MADLPGGVDELVAVAHLTERLADDGLMHNYGCRICEAVFRSPLDRQLALIRRAAAVHSERDRTPPAVEP